MARNRRSVFSNQSKAMAIIKASGLGGKSTRQYLLLLIAVHAGATLFHHYMQKENTFLRVMPEHKHLNN